MAWSCEQVARVIGCSPQQIKRLCDLDKLCSYKTSNDGIQSMYSYRIEEKDLLTFFGCHTIEEFKKVQYR